jgi:SAM-dependent methyltransferase
MALTQNDKKHWPPIQSVMDYLTETVIQKDAKVLEVGPGHAPFKRADVSVDFVDVEGLPNLIKVDLGTQPLPFEDKSFDFVFCRHCLEDMYNPFLLCSEMSRVAKAGYIEMPSPFAELGRGVDGGSPPFRGYHHHRFISWVIGDELRMISKYPFLEYLRFDEPSIDAQLRSGDRYWNTYYLWTDKINVVHRQSPIDFSIPRDYALVLNEAMERSKEATDIFFINMKAGRSA